MSIKTIATVLVIALSGVAATGFASTAKAENVPGGNPVCSPKRNTRLFPRQSGGRRRLRSLGTGARKGRIRETGGIRNGSPRRRKPSRRGNRLPRERRVGVGASTARSDVGIYSHVRA